MNFADLQKRIHFCHKQIDLLFDRLERMEEAIKTHEDDLEMASRSMYEFEEKIKQLRAVARKNSKIKVKQKLQLIQNNLQSVTRQLSEKEPRPFIPPETWEAFEEFVIKLNGTKKN